MRGRRETARLAATHRPQREAFSPCGQVRQDAHSSVRKPWIQSSIVVVMPETLAMGTPAYSSRADVALSGGSGGLTTCSRAAPPPLHEHGTAACQARVVRLCNCAAGAATD